MSYDWQRQTEKVICYYESTAKDYKLFWIGLEDLAVHFGYYDQSVKSHRESLLKMNEMLARYANITSKDNVLDAGCGYGGSAIWLAKHIGCRVAGITLVSSQVQQAKRYAEKHSVSESVHFTQMDYTHTSFPDSSFDVIWALESIVHTASKQAFIREAHRLLSTGGRLLIGEYMLREHPPLSQAEKDTFSPWLEGWAMPSLLIVGEYRRPLGDGGFTIVQIHDVIENVRRSVNRLGKLQLPTLPTAQVFAAIARGLCVLKLFRQERLKNIEAGICQNKTLRAGQWMYIVLLAEKIDREELASVVLQK